MITKVVVSNNPDSLYLVTKLMEMGKRIDEVILYINNNVPYDMHRIKEALDEENIKHSIIRSDNANFYFRGAILVSNS